jgi:hypothetical protein
MLWSFVGIIDYNSSVLEARKCVPSHARGWFYSDVNFLSQNNGVWGAVVPEHETDKRGNQHQYEVRQPTEGAVLNVMGLKVPPQLLISGSGVGCDLLLFHVLPLGACMAVAGQLFWKRTRECHRWLHPCKWVCRVWAVLQTASRP